MPVEPLVCITRAVKSLSSAGFSLGLRRAASDVLYTHADRDAMGTSVISVEPVLAFWPCSSKDAWQMMWLAEVARQR